MPDDNGEKDESEKDDKSTDGSTEDKTKSATIDDVERIVKGAIEEVKNVLVDNDQKKTTRPRPARAGEGRSSATRSFRDTERVSSEMVQDAIKRALLDQEHEKEHKELEKAKQEVQKAPMLPRKTTQWLLGKRFIEDKNK